MKVAYTTAYGAPDVIELREAPMPEPQAGEVLVRIHAAAVTAGDSRLRSQDIPTGFGLMTRLLFGIRRPRRPVMGWYFAGTVMANGGDAGRFPPGTKVIGLCGARGGAHAEYVAIPQSQLVELPRGLSMEEGAAFFFGGLTAHDFILVRAGLRAGEHILINGATGAVGSAAIQMAKAVGAEITAVCSARNADLARSLGADHVFDYRKASPLGPFDVIMDVIGTIPERMAQRLLRPGGRLAIVTSDLPTLFMATAFPDRGGIHRLAGTSAEIPQAMRRLMDIAASGAYRPLVGTVLPFAAIHEAHAIADGRHKTGNLILRMV